MRTLEQCSLVIGLLETMRWLYSLLGSRAHIVMYAEYVRPNKTGICAEGFVLLVSETNRKRNSDHLRTCRVACSFASSVLMHSWLLFCIAFVTLTYRSVLKGHYRADTEHFYNFVVPMWWENIRT
jgi:hypothetical protein